VLQLHLLYRYVSQLGSNVVAGLVEVQLVFVRVFGADETKIANLIVQGLVLHKDLATVGFTTDRDVIPVPDDGALEKEIDIYPIIRATTIITNPSISILS